MGCTESRPDLAGFQYAVPIKPLTSAVGESQIFRAPENKNELTHTLRGEPEITTVHEAYIRSFAKYPNNNFLGTREKAADGKLGHYKFKTYAQVHEITTKLGSGMVNLGLNASTQHQNDADFVIMWSKNREEWLMTDIACVLYKMCLVPVYDTLGPETITYIFSQTRSSTLFVAPEHLDSAIQNAHKFETLRNIIVFDSATPEQKSKAEAAKLRLFNYEEVIASGHQQKQQYRSSHPEDLYTVNYTSGTTGLPKGVMITHRNQLASSSAVNNRTDININPSDVYISYLPLAHTLERTALLTFALGGCTIGFYGGDVQKISADLVELKPTIFVSVPRLYNRLYDKMTDGVSKLTGAKKSLAEGAIKTKLENLQQHGVLHHTLYDSLVFKKMKEAMGGKVRLMLNGSAPIEPAVENFLRIAIGVPFVGGYGQTETTAASFISRADVPSFGHTGGPEGCIEYKVVDVPEMNYTSEDRDAYGLPTPRGEVCMRGPAAFKGYYKDPERTAETIDKDGWVHTGDIGRINADGSLSIIDRKKNIFKLAQGEYVASEKVENTYLACKYVAEAFLYGDSLKTHCIAIVVPNKENLLTLGKELNLQNLSYEQLCQNDQIKTRVLAEMTQKGKEQKIPSFELAKQLYLEPVSFGEKGLLTPTFKLVRHSAKQFYQKVIDDLYKLPLPEAAPKK